MSKSVIRRLTVLVVMAVLGLVVASPAWAASTITVNSTSDAAADDGQCTLREAITSTNTDTASGDAPGECTAGSGDDTIDVAGVTGTVNLTGELPALSGNVGIEGPGDDELTVRRDTGGNYRIFRVTSGSVVSISGITISNGYAAYLGSGYDYGYHGGGILNLGNLTITDSTISHNIATDAGGGIYSKTPAAP